MMVPLPPRIRLPLPPAVVSWGLPGAVNETIRRVVGTACQFTVARSGEEVSIELATNTTPCVVVPVPADRQHDLWDGLSRLRRAYPRVPFVAVAIPQHSSFRGAGQLGVLGVAEILTFDANSSGDEFAFALSRVHANGAASRAWAAAQLRLPESLVPVVKTALRLAHGPLTTTQLAGAVRLHERSLRKYCDRERLPNPQFIVGWSRLLMVAFYLDEPGRSLQALAEMLAFPSESALRKQLQRYTHSSASQLRQRGALRTTAGLFEQAVHAANAVHAHNAPAPRLTLVRAGDSGVEPRAG